MCVCLLFLFILVCLICVFKVFQIASRTRHQGQRTTGKSSGQSQSLHVERVKPPGDRTRSAHSHDETTSEAGRSTDSVHPLHTQRFFPAGNVTRSTPQRVIPVTPSTHSAHQFRVVLFGFHHQVFLMHPKVFCWILLDLPGLLFFSAYTLLLLFWAQIYHESRSLPTDKLRKTYIAVNVAVYLAQVVIWICIWLNDNSTVKLVGKIFMAVVSLIAALGFLHHGGRLFVMLKRFPIESKGRTNKLHEVGSVTAICFAYFLIRSIVVGLSPFDRDLRLDVLNRPVQNLIYYMVAEIIPSALVLFILRKLPPKRSQPAQY